MKRRLALILAGVLVAGSGVAYAVTMFPDDGTANPEGNNATWEATTPVPCPAGLTIEQQTATFTAYTVTPIDAYVDLPTCDVSRP